MSTTTEKATQIKAADPRTWKVAPQKKVPVIATLLIIASLMIVLVALPMRNVPQNVVTQQAPHQIEKAVPTAIPTEEALPVISVFGQVSAANVTVDPEMVKLMETQNVTPLFSGVTLPQVTEETAQHQQKFVTAFLAGDRTQMSTEANWLKAALSENPHTVQPRYVELVQGLQTVGESNVSVGTIPFLANVVYALRALGEKSSSNATLANAFAAGDSVFNEAVSTLSLQHAQAVAAQNAQVQSNGSNNNGSSTNTTVRNVSPIENKVTENKLDAKTVSVIAANSTAQLGITWSPINLLISVRALWDAITNQGGAAELDAPWYVVGVWNETPQGAQMLGLNNIKIQYIFLSHDASAKPLDNWEPAPLNFPQPTWHGNDSSGHYWVATISIWHGGPLVQEGQVIKSSPTFGFMIPNK